MTAVLTSWVRMEYGGGGAGQKQGVPPGGSSNIREMAWDHEEVGNVELEVSALSANRMC